MTDGQIGLVLLVLLVLIGVGYRYSTGLKTPAVPIVPPPGSTVSPSTEKPIPSTLIDTTPEHNLPPPGSIKAPPPAMGTYFWMKDSGNGYVNGVPYANAEAYCKSSGQGSLASTDHLLQARTKGFEACTYGWTSDGMPAFVMQKDGLDGCYTSDGISLSRGAATSKYSVYCVKDIPMGSTFMTPSGAATMGTAKPLSW